MFVRGERLCNRNFKKDRPERKHYTRWPVKRRPDKLMYKRCTRPNILTGLYRDIANWHHDRYFHDFQTFHRPNNESSYQSTMKIICSALILTLFQSLHVRKQLFFNLNAGLKRFLTYRRKKWYKDLTFKYCQATSGVIHPSFVVMVQSTEPLVGFRKREHYVRHIR